MPDISTFDLCPIRTITAGDSPLLVAKTHCCSSNSPEGMHGAVEETLEKSKRKMPVKCVISPAFVIYSFINSWVPGQTPGF